MLLSKATYIWEIHTFTFTFMHLADTLIQSNLHLHSGFTFIIFYQYVLHPWELNPQPQN